MKNFFEKTKTFLKNSKGLVAAGAFCLVAVIFVCGFIAYSEGYSKVFPGTKVEGLDISGMTVTEAAREIEDSFGRVDEERSLEISCGEVKKTVSFGDLKVNIDSQKTARNAFDIDRKGGALNKTVNLVSSLFNTKNIDIEASMDKTFLEDLIVELADGKELSPTNTTYRVDGDNLIIVKGNGGKMIDRQKAKRDIIKAAIDPRIKKIEFEIETLKAPQIDLDKFYEELTKPARDAEYRLDGDEVIIDAEKIGITVEKSQIKTALESNQEEYSIKVKTEMPKVTAKQLGELLFKDVMGKYSSNFATSSYSRATNVILTAERINGKILMPGDVFSYDSTIGKRTIQNGYKEAGVYVGNKVESGIGGGICQTSSTLYSAALYADLEIVNRTSHSLPVAYVPLGMDATIAEGYIDLKIKNNTPYPVKIEAIVSGRNLTCSFLGVKDPDKTIEVINTITEVYEPSTERTENPEIPKGYKNIINKGAKGYKVESSRIVKKQGEVIRTEKLVRSIYRAAPIEEEINPLDKETPSEMLKIYTPGMIVEEPQEEDVAETVTSGEELLEDETEKDQDAEVFDESIEDVNV